MFSSACQNFLCVLGFYTPQQCLLCDSTELALGINKSHIWRRIEVDLKASQLICQSSPLPCHHSTHHKLQLNQQQHFSDEARLNDNDALSSRDLFVLTLHHLDGFVFTINIKWHYIRNII